MIQVTVEFTSEGSRIRDMFVLIVFLGSYITVQSLKGF